MQVLPSGAVVRPYQPAFFATGSGGTITISPGSYIPFNQLNTTFAGSNRNSGFNTSTYLYTAPVAGLYYFYAQFYLETAEALAWWKNGSQLLYNDVALVTFANNLSSSAYQILNGSAIIDLASGDYIGIQVRTGTSNVTMYMGHSTFFGYLAA
jgi:hypothetical protein